MLFICPFATAQHFPFREYTVLDGLPHNQVNASYQDSRGFIWFATLNGVSRFDGTEFRNYFHKDGLLRNTCQVIFEDGEKNLWVSSASGLSRYTGTGFVSFPYSADLKSFGFIWAKYINDTIFLRYDDQLSSPRSRILWFGDGKYHEYSNNHPEFSGITPEDLLFDSRSGRYFLVDEKSKVLERRKGGFYSLPGVSFRRTEKDIPVFTDSLLEYIPDGDTISRYEPGNGMNVSYPEGSPGPVTVSLSVSNQKTRVVIPANSVPFLDREMNLWYDPEMNIYRLVSTAFTSFSVADGLPENAWAIAEDRNGHIWFGSLFESLSEYDGEKFIRRNDYKKSVRGKRYFYKGSITRSNGDVLFSTNFGVLVWDGKSFSEIPVLKGMQVCVIYEDPSDKSILFGTDHGLFRMDNGKMESFPEFTSESYGVIEGIARDDSGRYWLSGQKGLVLKDGTVSTPVADSVLPSGYTYTVVKDSHNGIWVSSEEGLFVRPGGSGRFMHGLPQEINSTANVVAEMDSNHIIAGRNRDICIIDIPAFYRGDRDYYKIYDSSSGFSGNDCLDHGIIKAREGRFWILTSGKVVILDPAKLRTDSNPPLVHVTDIYCQTDSLTWNRLEIPGLFYGKQGVIRLTHLQNDIRVNFTGISFRNPEKVIYQYRLLGSNSIWSARNSAREAVFSDLTPGKYEFQLLAFNADGVSSNEPFSLEFTVIPAFWQTLVFRIGAFILAASLIVMATLFVVRRNTRIRNEREKIKNELSRLQMNSILGQFEPHFTFNVISSAGSLILKGEKDKAYDYLVKLSGLLRSVLSDGTLVIRSLGEELDFVRNYCELQQLRFRERLSWEINVSENVNLQRQIPRMTIQTFVENSVKHGFENKAEGGKILIKISQAGSGLLIDITDNGIGRLAAEKMKSAKSGHGLKTITGIFNFMNRFNQENASIELTDLFDSANQPCGTAVRISIPDNYIFEVMSYTPEN